MTFQVGPHAYTAQIYPGTIRVDGHILNGYCDREERRILIGLDVPICQRLAVLLHEVTHAWLFAVPMPRTQEEACELFALVGEQTLKDLEAQGGRDALDAMRPRECPIPGADRMRFQIVDGQMLPMLPHHKVDGVTTFDLEGAAKWTGTPATVLAAQWETTWRGILPKGGAR